MDFFSVAVAVLLVLLVLLLCYTVYMSKDHGVFKKMGVVHDAPWPIFGNFIAEARQGIFKYNVDAYQKYKAHRVYGIYRTNRPILSVCDLDMVRDISVKKFNSFVNRRTFDTGPPFSHSMTMIKDDHWKNVRTTVSPAFSTNKLKRMYKHVESTTKMLVENLKEKQERNEPVELKDVLGHFTMDVIASSGFGYKLNSLKDKDDPFITNGKAILSNFSRFIIVAFFFEFLSPFFRKLGINLVPTRNSDFFCAFVDKAMEARKQEQEERSSFPRRHDFLQLMMESENDKLSDNDNMTSEEAEALGTQGEKKGLSYLDVQGQAFIFIFAGFDTVATAMSFTAFLLAMNPDCCKKAQEEIDEQLKGEFPNYESVQRLNYLDMCLNEAMRLYPPGFIVDRVCNEEVEVGGITIPEGMIVQIPHCAIHRDPDIWPEPEKFIPERFTPENKANRHPYAHSPFGQGPRNCIGMRLALLEMKVGLAAMLQVMTPVPCEKSVYPIELDYIRMKAKEDLWVKLEARK